MVLTTGGVIRSRLFARAALISAPLLFLHPDSTGVPAKSRQNPDRRETPVPTTVPFALTERRPQSLAGSIAELGCKPRWSSDREAEFERRNPAWRQIHWSLRRRNIPVALCATVPCETTAELGDRAAQSFRYRRP